MTLGFAPQLKAQDINTVAGGGVPGGAATSVDIPGPTSVVQDASGNLYIAAPDSYYIFKVDTTGNLSIIAGQGWEGYEGDGGPATSANLSGPTSLTFDGSGNLYFIDLNKVRMINTSGVISTVVGNGQLCADKKNPCGDGGPATSAQLGDPQQVAVDSSGDIYIADTQDMRIREVTASTGVINTIAGTGLICSGPLFTCGDGGPGTSANLDLPGGIAVDGLGNLYIADTRDQRIRVLDLATGIINKFAATGKHCPKPTENCGDGGPALSAYVFNPWGMAVDVNNNVFFADELDNRVREVNVSDDIINTVIGSGAQGFSGDGGPPKKADLDEPKGFFAATGGYIVADTGNNRIREASKGVLNTLAGGGSGGDGGAATSANLASPIGVAWDSSGNIYIADTGNNRIRCMVMVAGGCNGSNAAVGDIVTFAGTGSLGWTGDGGPATGATLNGPSGVAVDGSGNVYIADLGNLVVREVNTSGTITTIAGSGIPCVESTNACGDGGPATSAHITSPTSVAVDSAGNVYIADPYDQKIREVNTSGIISTVAGDGKRGNGGDKGPAVNAHLNRPYGVAVDGSTPANIYIADSGNNRVRCVVTVAGGCNGSTSKVGNIVAYAFNGQATFAGDGGPALSASQQNPLEVEIDPSGNLFVGGGADEVVREIAAPGTHTVGTVAGNPNHPLRSGFAGDGGPATQAMLDNIGLAINASDSLLIADTGNNRIRQVNLGNKK